MTKYVRYPDVSVELTGHSSNAFMVIGRVSRALREQVSPEAATEFANAAVVCGSYKELLVLAVSTVNVS